MILKKLFLLELNRLKHSYTIFFIILLTIIIGVLGIVLNSIYYGDSNPEIGMLSVFNAYTQFTYLMLGFVFIHTFVKDYDKGITNFYLQQGYSLSKQTICKFTLLCVIVLPFIDVLLIIANLIYKNSDIQYLLKLIIIIELSTVYIILLAILIATLVKKSISAVLIFYGLFIILNVANIFTLGLLNPADGNSISTYLLSEYCGRTIVHFTLDHFKEQLLKYSDLLSIIIPFFYCLILLGVNTVLFNKIKRM